jgi:CMP-2-keto-3-deoxyoctulosonic acid synthetase
MTASEIPNGTERCNAAQLALSEQYDIVVNIQVNIVPAAIPFLTLSQHGMHTQLLQQPSQVTA